MATITLQGNEIHTNGDLPAVGDKAPDFKLVNKELSDVSLKDYAGNKKIISIVPSLDTPVCATSTKKFGELELCLNSKSTPCTFAGYSSSCPCVCNTCLPTLS